MESREGGECEREIVDEDLDGDSSPWRELLELLWEERRYFLLPLVVGLSLAALGLIGAQAAGPLAPFLYPYF